MITIIFIVAAAVIGFLGGIYTERLANYKTGNKVI